MTIIYNKEEKKEIRRYLRKNSTRPEQIIWRELRAGKLWVKFRRQYSIWRYILDFYCAKQRLCIEVDGESHFSQEWREYDEIRTEYLEALWIEVLRFTNMDVIDNISGVLERIHDRVNKNDILPIQVC